MEFAAIALIVFGVAACKWILDHARERARYQETVLRRMTQYRDL